MDEISDNRHVPFFRRLDWASFWTATALSFLVYFFTLGPSVGLEDSGELAVAGDHLGVPHPPGYPIWTMISFCFARVFSFVTYRGQPNPAWCIALVSAVFGALAAGCTAMLITRSASDMLKSAHESLKAINEKRSDVLCWSGGVAGSLIFAFSPVMWSQATIVEVYSLGAFFLMLVMLLTYRWMRQPSDKLLWLTAFVFGLGLTNYQVLLLAALPLIVIIFLRNIAMFRDFLLVCIPFGIAALLLQLGSQPSYPGLVKQMPLSGMIELPNNAICVASLIVFCVAMIALVAWPVLQKRISSEKKEHITSLFRTIVVGTFAVSVFLMFLGAMDVTKAAFTNPQNVALVAPAFYVKIGALLLAATGACAVSAIFGGDKWSDPWRFVPLFVAAVLAIVSFVAVESIGAPSTKTVVDFNSTFDMTPYSVALKGGLILMLALSLTTKRGICFALPVAIIEFTVFLLTGKGAMMGLTHPSTWWFWAPVVFNFILLFMAALALPHGRSVAMTIFATELGVSFYAYMPIVSDLRNPPMNWGYPRTWEGFKHAITRGQYEKIAPTDMFAPRFLQQVGGYFSDLRTQFTLLIVPFGFLPFAAWRTGADDRKGINVKLLCVSFGLLVVAGLFWGIDNWSTSTAIIDNGALFNLLGFIILLGAIAIAVLSGVQPIVIALFFAMIAVAFAILGTIPSVERIFDDARLDKLSMVGISIIGLIGGIMIAYRQLEESAYNALKSDDRSQKTTTCLVLVGCGIFLFAFFYKAIQAVMLAKMAIAAKMLDISTPDVWSKVLEHFSSYASIKVFPALLALLVVAGGGYLFRCLHKREIVRNSLDNISKQWLIGTVCNFLVMSLLLIVLANPKGDLQDTFIQKVKFISSHGLFALWIGYGLIFALVTIDSLCNAIFKPSKQECGGCNVRMKRYAVAAVSTLALVFVLATPLIPIRENYFNDQLVFELSSAEQNGHDFGWQFGNYQLRGADAITEELEADEEPLPNPLYPQPMGEGAIFFGGTDPGRFVPTYMIYSADVRPDVFLITQNALADNTFMSVTRDLYGDQIWIPTPDESASAFQIYVEEVNSGKRPRNADLHIEGGRVQVVGALGVMEINGILCKMIFDHNKPWHKFYVEESYVIPWMYPYLTPHGLIMHINPEQTVLSTENINDDMDFWDWYTRRLTRDERYHRDLVAKKSFSKLRSAIAGLYVSRGRLGSAARAYIESRVLYNVSPEANFRMVQDVLLRQGRYDEAMDVVNDFCKADPRNDRGPMFREFISSTQQRQRQLMEYSQKFGDGKSTPTLQEALSIAACYRDIGSNQSGINALAPFVDESNLTVGQVYDLAQMLLSLGSPQLAVRAFDRIVSTKYIMNNPGKIMSAISAYAAVGNYQKMYMLLSVYLKAEPMAWEAWIDMASLELARGDSKKAVAALEQSIRYGREASIRKIEQVPQLVNLLNSIQGGNAAPKSKLGLGF